MNCNSRKTIDLIVTNAERRGGMGGLLGALGLMAQLVRFVLNVVATFLFLLAVALICGTVMLVMERCSPAPPAPTRHVPVTNAAAGVSAIQRVRRAEACNGEDPERHWEWRATRFWGTGRSY